MRTAVVGLVVLFAIVNAVSAFELLLETNGVPLEAANSCFAQRYLSEDETCTTNPLTATPCKFGQVCVPNENGRLHCHSRRDGATCPGNSDTECGAAYVCVGGYCRVRRWAGEGCMANKQCISYNCQNGFCTGKELGESCSFSVVDGGVTYATENQCGVGLFCDYLTQKCEEDYQEGHACGWGDFPLAMIGTILSAAQASCDRGLYCDYALVLDPAAGKASNPGHCRQFYDGKAGEVCNQYSRCRVGHACINNVCTPSSVGDLCVPAKGHADCPAGTFCLCDMATNVTRCMTSSTPSKYIGCEPESQAFYNCLEDVPCHYPFTYDFIEGSCGYPSCLDEFQAMKTCLGCNAAADYFENGDPACPPDSSAIMPIAMSAIGAAILAAMVAVML